MLLDFHKEGGVPLGSGLVPLPCQNDHRAGSTPAQPASLHAPHSVRPVIQSRVQPLKDPSVFNVLNLFCAHWFLNCEYLLSLILSAVKGGDNNEMMWIDLLPQDHSHSYTWYLPPLHAVLTDIIYNCLQVVGSYILYEAPMKGLDFVTVATAGLLLCGDLKLIQTKKKKGSYKEQA